MTIEEAINNNKNLRMYMRLSDKNQPYKFLEENYIALDMAIKALEQEPCSDAISRQAAIDAMYALCDTGETLKENPWRDNPHIDAITDALDTLQPVIPQPKTGHWIGHREHCENLGVMPSGLGAYEWCSNCDCGIDVMEWHRDNYNYCPNCGAKMIEPQESEDI